MNGDTNKKWYEISEDYSYLDWLLGWWETWCFRIFVRGRCAFRGCEIKHYASWNLPEGISEWGCKYCNAEGIGNQEYVRPFYGDNKLEDLLTAIKGG